MSAAAVLAWIGLALGLVVLVTVAVLLQRVLRPILEIERYARDTLDAGLGIAHNLDGADELARTRTGALALRGAALAYLERLGGGR